MKEKIPYSDFDKLDLRDNRWLELIRLSAK